ncbi:Uncharacterised protein [Mycobacteroides abscessus subsp. abscessus]|nr:Uncharacterised protein [Mycobacteroides abscessus subsp. abscessus]
MRGLTDIYIMGVVDENEVGGALRLTGVCLRARAYRARFRWCPRQSRLVGGNGERTALGWRAGVGRGHEGDGGNDYGAAVHGVSW